MSAHTNRVSNQEARRSTSDTTGDASSIAPSESDSVPPLLVVSGNYCDSSDSESEGSENDYGLMDRLAYDSSDDDETYAIQDAHKKARKAIDEHIAWRRSVGGDTSDIASTTSDDVNSLAPSTSDEDSLPAMWEGAEFERGRDWDLSDSEDESGDTEDNEPTFTSIPVNGPTTIGYRDLDKWKFIPVERPEHVPSSVDKTIFKDLKPDTPTHTHTSTYTPCVQRIYDRRIKRPLHKPREEDKSSTRCYRAYNLERKKVRRRIARLKKLIAQALADRGANGTIAGKGCRIGDRTDRYIDVTGIKDHTIQELNIVEALFVAKSTRGNMVVHCPESAHMPGAKTIIAPIQMEAHGCKVVDKPPAANDGIQPYIETPDGYRFPLSIRDGLPYLDIRPPLDEEMETLVHVYFTGSAEWDPRILDQEVKPEWYTETKDNVEEYYDGMPFDRHGNPKEDDGQAVEDPEMEGYTRAEMEVNLADIVADKLVPSVIEIQVDHSIFHRDVDEYDETCDWGDWEDEERGHRYSFDVEGRRRSKRNKKPVYYGPQPKNKKRDERSAEAISDRKRAENGESIAPTTETVTTAHETLEASRLMRAVLRRDITTRPSQPTKTMEVPYRVAQLLGNTRREITRNTPHCLGVYPKK